jgi:hypothetical protein
MVDGKEQDGRFIKGALLYFTVNGGISKEKTIVSIGRRLTELMYSLLRDKSNYESCVWAGGHEYLEKVKRLKKSA